MFLVANWLMKFPHSLFKSTFHRFPEICFGLQKDADVTEAIFHLLSFQKVLCLAANSLGKYIAYGFQFHDW